MLKLKNITKDYLAGDSKVEALRGISIEFRKSEFVSVLGPSGCGKTTLLNIIGGLDRYTKGDLIIAGRSTKKYKDKDWDAYRNHSIGFVFQSYNLIPHQTVLANVELALTLSGVSRAERRRRAADALSQVGLSDQMHKRPGQLSGGQMQRVAIARALVNDPEILLADEPTGALDSATSVQVMEILKNIAKDRLIIMVTHNPELAKEYSTRIVRLLDGQITDDTNPYDGGEEEMPQESAEGKTGRTSMSFFTALSLSFHNLMTKKARTFLTSFAGSIGIIGIALILSLSSGVQAYIDRVEEDTLSSYPIQLMETTVDYTSMMNAIMDVNAANVTHDTDKIYSNTVMTEVMNSMLDEVTVNNLEAFKAYLESHEQVPDLISDIRYTYSTTMNVYAADTTEKIVQVHPSTVFAKISAGMGMPEGMESEMQDMSAMTGANQMDVWVEMLDNPELLEKQYDVIAGKMPELYNEVVLIVDENNEVSDYALYALGLKDQDEVTETMKKLMQGEKIESHPVSYTDEEILALTFKLLLNTDYFEKTESGWADRTADEEYLRAKLANATEIRVVGILRPSANSNMGAQTGSIGFLPSLTEYLIRRVNDSDIVKAQLADPETDVFTGIAFEQPEEIVWTMDSLMAYIAALPADESAQYSAAIAQMQQSGMPEAQIVSMFASAMTPPTTDATYEGNLTRLGVSDLDKPSSILIYPKDFESKERMSDLIAEYNASVEDSDQIQYTDYIGLLLSSVTTVINAISYILIAFVAISLVVSSIMIGIITYISVLERTKEIGILRSIGASKRDVSRVFNAETLTVGFVAGALGILVTVVLDLIASVILEAITGIGGLAALPWEGALVLIVISMVLTFVAGLIPAGLAAKKDPVVALRSE